MGRDHALIACALSLILTASIGAAQPRDVDRKQARATRVANGSVHVDGRLDEAVWALAEPIADFTQKEPVEGAPPTARTEIRFVFDGDAFYVGARMSSAPDGRIQAPLTRRDDGGQAEHIKIDLDTYLDRRTASSFGVTAAGVRLDSYHSTDDADSDAQYNPVWEARTAIGDREWTAELRIPFSQLRFHALDELVWGLNVTRSIPSEQELDYWVMVPRTARGWASRFGDVVGISGIHPSYRIELLPYAASSSALTGTPEPGNPFDDGSTTIRRFGLDAKIGVGPNLTLDATVNPDFGQIEADPAEVNLSAFETFFPERRPFFLEGSGLISAQSNLFYSRRIGARPTAPANGDFVDYPETTSILGAAKLTGRLRSSTSIGILGALTSDESARIAVGSGRDRVRVAPQTEFFAGHVQQQFGADSSTVGVGFTQMHRRLDDDDPLAALLDRNAVSGGIDASLRFHDRTYESNLFAGFSHIDGTPAAIARRQTSNVRYFQRPDGPVDRFDPSRTSLGGTTLQASLAKIAGRHWLWGGDFRADSPEFETNDAGQLNDAGDIHTGAHLEYRETEPGRLFHNYSINGNVNRTSDYDGALGGRQSFGSFVVLTYRNFWYSVLNTEYESGGRDARATRGGPSMGTTNRWAVSASTSSSDATEYQWNIFGSLAHTDVGDSFSEVNASASIRPSPRLQLSVSTSYNTQIDARQYVTTLDQGHPETYGNRYIFGRIDRSTISAQIRASYTFKPDLNLDVYAEPFAASGRYTDFGELAAPGRIGLVEYGSGAVSLERLPDGTYRAADTLGSFEFRGDDFDVRSFRSNVVLRWEWRPGSTFFLIWQQDRGEALPALMPGNLVGHVGAGDLFNAFTASGSNILAVKATWWLSR